MNRIIGLLAFAVCLGGLSLMAAVPKASQKKRIYLGFTIPNSVKLDSVRTYIINQLKTKNPDLQYTVDKPHITLSFIGEVDESELATVQYAICQAVQEFKKQYGPRALSGMSIEKGADLFIKQNRSMIVLKVKAPSALYELKKIIDKKLKESGISVSSVSYIPHITMARIRSTIDTKQAQNMLKTVNPPIGSRAEKQESFAFDKLYLFQSPDTVLTSFEV